MSGVLQVTAEDEEEEYVVVAELVALEPAVEVPLVMVVEVVEAANGLLTLTNPPPPTA